MWRNWDCIDLYLPTINLRVNTWTIVPLASLSRPNGPWHVCCLEQHKYKSERWWIGPCYVDIDSRYKRVAVKLLQENRTQPWAVGCTEEARGRAAGINISEQEKTWLRREKQRGKGLKKDEEVEGEKRRLVGRESSEGSDGGSPSAMASDSAQSFPLGLLHCDLLEHAGTLWGQVSLSIPLSVSPLTFLLYKLTYFCPSGTSGFMICDGFIFSNIMSLSSSSFRVFSHVTIYLDFFLLVFGSFFISLMLCQPLGFSLALSL